MDAKHAHRLISIIHALASEFQRAINSYFTTRGVVGRLEVGCRILSAYRGRGYTGEAMAAMFEWAATRLGITRFLVAVSSPDASAPRLMTELDMSGASGWGERIAEIEGVLDPHL